MNRGPITVTPITPILRVYGIFRGMGTRHTPVVNDAMEPVGMITRKELMSDFLNQVQVPFAHVENNLYEGLKKQIADERARLADSGRRDDRGGGHGPVQPVVPRVVLVRSK